MMIIDRLSGRDEFCRWLYEMGAKRGAEIGVWTGEFAEQMCATVPKLHLICVDPWMEYPAYTDGKNKQDRLDVAYQATLSRMARYPHTILRLTSEVASREVPDGSLDFVYIDGNHAEAFVYRDLELWTPKVRSGGLIAGHDYEVEKKHAHVEVKPAVDRFMQEHGIPKGYVLARNKAASYYWVNP